MRGTESISWTSSAQRAKAGDRFGVDLVEPLLRECRPEVVR
jgi:hypothetical protein